MNPDRLPIVVTIDIEPDRRVLGRRHRERLAGFEKLLGLLDTVRDHIAERSGAPVQFTWLLRMDPQIADVYGTPTALASMYEPELGSLLARGDQIGLHQHTWRWLDHWVADHGDPAWVAHCVDMGLAAYREAFGEACHVFSFGDGFMSTTVARQLDDAGVRVDLTVEPGMPAVLRDIPTEDSTGWRPNTSTAPTMAYRPSRDDFRLPDPTRSDGILFLPRTPGVELSLSPVDGRLAPSGRYRTLHPWTAPGEFRDMLAVRLDAPGLTHMSHALRTDIALLSDPWAALETNLLAEAELLGPRARWCTASEAERALAPNVGTTAAITRERAALGAGCWLLGEEDPGFREGIDAEELDLSAIPLAEVPVEPMSVRVSAILPVFNGGHHLRHAVTSVVAQTEPPEELIVVDDGSSDGCTDFLHGVSAPFPIRMVRQANAGQSAARNRGARIARGGLLAFLDQDDAWHPRHLAVLRSSFLTDPTVGWSYSDFDEVDARGNIVTHSYLRDREVEHPRSTLAACLASDLMVIPSATLIRRQAFDALGGFDETLQGYEDDDLYVRTFRAGWRFTFHPEALVRYRVHGAGSSADTSFAVSRQRFAEKLEAMIPDDPHTNRHYFRDQIAPRFFQASLDDYVRATSARDWSRARTAFRSMRHFGMRRRHPPRWKLAVVRNPRIFRWLLRVHDHAPRALRLTDNPLLQLR